MNDSTKEFSSKQEKLISNELGWETVVASGARPGAPGDIISEEWLGECKTHTAPGNKIFFDALVWDKIQQEAMMRHRKPVLFVDDGSQSLDNTWVLCNEASILQVNTASVDFPFAVRKNVSFDSEKGKVKLKEFFSKSGGGIVFDNMIYSLTWGTSQVVIMEFSTFKELFDL